MQYKECKFNYSRVVRELARPDVLVCGGGPAGLCAAVSASRAGASVMLVEQNGYAGGMATAGLVAPFMTCYEGSGNTRVIRGIFDEIVARLVARGAAIDPSDVPAGSDFSSWIGPGHLHVTPFEAEVLKLVADEMLTEAGVNVLYHTTVVGADAEGGRIYRVIAHRKQGYLAIEPKIVIDCTGDADVAAEAGFEYTVGDGANPPKIQPVTMFFRVGNLDNAAMQADIEANRDKFYRRDGVNYRSFNWHVARARAAGDWDLNRVSVGIYRSVREDEWNVNTARSVGIDGTKSEELTRAEIEGRRQVEVIFNFIKKYLPGCADARLLASGSTVGVRETRHVKGLHTLRSEELLAGVKPADSILLAANSVDVHGKFGAASTQYIPIPDGVSYGVPYRCLVPVGSRNLLIAGRSLSAEQDAAGAVRVMPPVMAMGQAAGIAAATAARYGIGVADVDTDALRADLVRAGAYLG